MNPTGISSQLDTIKAEMIANLGTFVSIGTSIGLIGALLYISYRVWGSLARAEPIDVFPLLRPFAIAFVIVFFGAFTGFIDGISNSIGQVTESVVKDSESKLKNTIYKYEQARDAKLSKDVQELLGLSDKEVEGDGKKDGLWTSLKKIILKISKTLGGLITAGDRFLQQKIHWFLRSAQGLMVVGLDVISTFILIILTLLGPITFGIACFDGFGHLITGWIGRYASTALWVPIAKVLSGILNRVEISVYEAHITALQDTNVPPDDTVLILFYIVGIIAYCMVPTIAGWVIDGGGTGGMSSKAAQVVMYPVKVGTAVAGSAVGGAAVVASAGGSQVINTVKSTFTRGRNSSKNDSSETPRQG